MWAFQEEDIVTCLRARPWLAVKNRMPEHFFRSIVLEEWKRDPWYSADQAAPFLGRRNRNCVLRYIRDGLLEAERVPRVLVGSSGPDGCWLIRKSAIDKFLAHDTRKADHYRRMVESRRAKRP